MKGLQVDAVLVVELREGQQWQAEAEMGGLWSLN